MMAAESIADIEIDYLPLPGGATVVEVLAAVYDLCEGVGDGNATCLDLHGRHKQIFDKLLEMEANGGLQSEAVTQFTTTLEEYWRQLDTYENMTSVERLLRHCKMKKAIARINDSVDQLFQMVQLTTADAIVDWRASYESDMDKQYKMLVKLVEDTMELLQELRGTRQMLDMTVLLTAEIDKINAGTSDLTPEARDAVREALRAIVVSSIDVHIEPTPKWFVPEADVDFEEVPFARSSLATVHRGRLASSGARVVVKMLLPGEGGFDANLQASLLKEANALYEARHPHIVSMLGACHVSQRPLIIYEEVANGSIKDYLNGDPPTRREHVWRLVYEASQGLAYLHSRGIIHGDVRLCNVLVAEAIHARLGDFGLARVKSKSRSKSMTKRRDGDASIGNNRWLAPDAFANVPQHESDVWALAMLIIEAFTGEPPYADVLDENEVKGRVLKGERPTRPVGMSDRAWDLIVDMTHAKRTNRIRIGEVVKRLGDLAKDEPAPHSLCESVPVELRTLIAVNPQQVLGDLKNGSSEEKIKAAWCLVQATASPESMEHYLSTASVRGLAIALEDTGNPALQEPLALALANIAQDERGAELIALRGGVALLAALLFETNERLREAALRALVQLIKDPMKGPMFVRAKGVEGLARHLSNASPNARAGVLSQLSELISSSADVATAVASHPALLDAYKGYASSTQRETKSSTTKLRGMSKEEKRVPWQCKVDGCDNYMIHKGLCFRHGGGRKCTVDGCSSIAKNGDLCWKHGGILKCSVVGCERRGKSRGLCWAHAVPSVTVQHEVGTASVTDYPLNQSKSVMGPDTQQLVVELAEHCTLGATARLCALSDEPAFSQRAYEAEGDFKC